MIAGSSGKPRLSRPLGDVPRHDQSKSAKDSRKPCFADTAPSTARAASTTSGPMPSPGMTATRCAGPRHQPPMPSRDTITGRQSRISTAPRTSNEMPDLIILVIGTAPEP